MGLSQSISAHFSTIARAALVRMCHTSEPTTQRSEAALETGVLSLPLVHAPIRVPVVVYLIRVGGIVPSIEVSEYRCSKDGAQVLAARDSDGRVYYTSIGRDWREVVELALRSHGGWR